MRKLLIPVCLLIGLNTFAQKEKSPFSKFGKITNETLGKEVYAIDSNANAVVLSRIGETSVVINAKGGFSLKTTVHNVTHILNEKGYDEANISIPLYVSSGANEEVSVFKAVTYNLEGGKIIEDKIGRSSLIKEKQDENHVLVKFTMPNVKKGSVIEYSYQVFSDFFTMPDPWYFQSTTAPTLWSEYTFAIPQFFFYHISSRGFIPLDIIESNKQDENFGSSAAPLTAGVEYKRWVAKNVPELKTEPYTKSVRNHLSRLDFQLNAFQHPLEYKSFRNSWQEIAKGLLTSEYFGKNLNTNNNWLKDEVQTLTLGISDPLQKAEKIFAYVRDDFKTTDPYAISMTDNMKSIFKAKKGNVCELNLLLTAMLRYIDLDAQPIMLSTAAHGYALEFFPLLNSMNYVVCKVNIGGKNYFLDASQSRLGFGRLPEYCYNGYSLIVDNNAGAINLSSDSLTEKKTVMNFFSNSDAGYSGTTTKNEGYYTSFDIRNTISEKGEDEYFNGIKKKYAESLTPSEFRIDSLKRYDDPLKIVYHLKLNLNDENILYINPYFGENYSKNPFASAKRVYPVEFPFVQEEILITTMEIPKGYKIDELPQSMRLKLDEKGQTYFEYRISGNDKMISFSSKLKIGKTFFMPEEYEGLREFFNMIVKKQSEQIVFKKVTL